METARFGRMWQNGHMRASSPVRAACRLPRDDRRVYIGSIYRVNKAAQGAMDVRTACLGALRRGDATGYEIKKLFEEGPFSHFFAAGFGSIYPALADLVRSGLVTVRDEPEDGRPTRKVHSITPAGRAALAAALKEPPAPDRLRSEWLFMAFFADLLPPVLIENRLRERIGWFRAAAAHLRQIDRTDMPPARAFSIGYGIAVYEAAAAYIEAHAGLLHAAAEAGPPNTDE